MIHSERKKIFTWHIHGSYLFYLSQGNFDIYIPVNEKRNEGYYGRGQTFPFGNNVIEVAAEQVKNLGFDVILYQTDTNYLIDQYEILSPQQRELPRVFLKHDTSMNGADIVVDDPSVLIVHVTHFNSLMWNNKDLNTLVIRHGVTNNGHLWSGRINKGITAVNHLCQRGRPMGADIFNKVRKTIPIDIIGMGTEDLAGFEVLHPYLPEYMANYRFYFNPSRVSSLPLSLCEVMMLGMPVVALATTELPLIIKDGFNGFIHNDPQYLIGKMKQLLENKELATELGRNARETAFELFGIERFINEWNEAFESVSIPAKTDLERTL
jgi:hypothetical protein